MFKATDSSNLGDVRPRAVLDDGLRTTPRSEGVIVTGQVDRSVPPSHGPALVGAATRTLAGSRPNGDTDDRGLGPVSSFVGAPSSPGKLAAR